jgi:hypothetical protein
VEETPEPWARREERLEKAAAAETMTRLRVDVEMGEGHCLKDRWPRTRVVGAESHEVDPIDRANSKAA